MTANVVELVLLASGQIQKRRGTAENVLDSGVAKCGFVYGSSLRILLEVWRWHRKTQPGQIRPLLAGVVDGVHISHGVAEVGDLEGLNVSGELVGQLVGQLNQSGWIRLVRGITHGDQGRIDQPQALRQHKTGGWRFSAAHKPPAMPPGRELIEERSLHEQRLVADEALPFSGITLGITAEVEATEHLDQGMSAWSVASVATQQFQAGIPIIVPEPFGLEGIDLRWRGPPAAVVMNGFLQGTPVAACDITDHTVDVEQQDGGFQRGLRLERLVG